MATVEQARAALDKWFERKLALQVRPAFYKAEHWQQAVIAAGTPPQGATYKYVNTTAVGQSSGGITQTIALNADGLTLSTGDVVWVGLNARGVLVIKELYA